LHPYSSKEFQWYQQHTPNYLKALNFNLHRTFSDENTQISITHALQITLQNHIGAPLLIEAFPGIPKTQTQGPYYYMTKHTKQTHYLNRWTVRFMAQSYNVITISQQIRVLHTELELN
jgi:hypothetical protein